MSSDSMHTPEQPGELDASLAHAVERHMNAMENAVLLGFIAYSHLQLRAFEKWLRDQSLLNTGYEGLAQKFLESETGSRATKIATDRINDETD